MHPRRRISLLAPVALVASFGAGAAQEERIGTLTLPQAASCFAEFDQACDRDGGRLWGVSIHGPVLLVDPLTRRVAGNQADAQGKLLEKDGVFVGAVPADQPIANAPLEWGGVRWAMVMVLFLGESERERVSLLAHESFHRVQPELGLYAFGEENTHLDTPEGRLWIQLEWNALQGALAAAGEPRRAAVQDALDFRAARRSVFPGAGARENPLELREGLASYTGLCLAGYAAADVPAHVAATRAKEDGFVRSFAYSSGPLYGFLLDAVRATWRAELDEKSDLGALLASALRLEPSAARAEARAAQHGGDVVRAAEEQRERERQERLAAWRAALIDGPVLVLDLSLVTSRTMDTRKVHPFDEGRTVFTERRLTAAWGSLHVSGGALLEDSASRQGRLSLRGAAADRKSGAGWTLTLAPRWTIVPGERAGDFVLEEEP